MPDLKVISSGIAELPNGPPLVVAIAGGTTGIGSYIAKALATTFGSHGSKLRVYIIGRNATRAEAVLTDVRQISPGSEWHFVQATDLALIGEVDRCCAELIRQETAAPFHGGPIRLDLLYMTHSYSPLATRSGELSGTIL
jgi:NAD(P)-dependent dehydrogenase (short-subunit alcohol dehydrogenase family)